MHHNFKELKIWQNAMSIVRNTYKVCEELPQSERFGLVSQIQRCAVSIPSNIAEGSGRTSEKEFAHFINIAISSSYELETQLLITKDLYSTEIDQNLIEIQILQKMIHNFKKKLV